MKKMHLKLYGGKEDKTLARCFYRQDYKKNWFCFLHFKNNFIYFIISITSLQYIKQ